MYQRLFAAKDEESAFRGAIYWLIGCILINIPLIMMATASKALNVTDVPDRAILDFAANILPFFIGGIILAVFTSFLITTGDSYLLSASTTFVYDVYERYIGRGRTSDSKKLFLNRAALIVFAMIAFAMVRFFPSVLAIQMYAYTIYGATITPALLGALLWKRANKYGGIASMLTGIVATLVCEFTLTKSSGINSIVVSVPLSILMIVVVSLITRRRRIEND